VTRLLRCSDPPDHDLERRRRRSVTFAMCRALALWPETSVSNSSVSLNAAGGHSRFEAEVWSMPEVRSIPGYAGSRGSEYRIRLQFIRTTRLTERSPAQGGTRLCGGCLWVCICTAIMCQYDVNRYVTKM
jgi:hypothetical protein